MQHPRCSQEGLTQFPEGQVSKTAMYVLRKAPCEPCPAHYHALVEISLRAPREGCLTSNQRGRFFHACITRHGLLPPRPSLSSSPSSPTYPSMRLRATTFVWPLRWRSHFTFRQDVTGQTSPTSGRARGSTRQHLLSFKPTRLISHVRSSDRELLPLSPQVRQERPVTQRPSHDASVLACAMGYPQG